MRASLQCNLLVCARSAFCMCANTMGDLYKCNALFSSDFAGAEPESLEKNSKEITRPARAATALLFENDSIV